MKRPLHVLSLILLVMFSACQRSEDVTLVRSKWLAKNGKLLHVLVRIEMTGGNESLGNGGIGITQRTMDVINERLQKYKGAMIVPVKDNEISIVIPYVEDPGSILSLIGQSGILKFQIVDDSKNTDDLEQMISDVRKEKNIPDGYSAEIMAQINEALASKLPSSSEIAFEVVRDAETKKIIRGIPYLIFKKVDVTGDLLQDARVQIYYNIPHVALTFDKVGASLFGELTKNNVKKRLAIILNGYVNKAPVIFEPILTGKAQITMGYGSYADILKEAENLAVILQSGPLPANITIIKSETEEASIRPISNKIINAIAIVVVLIVGVIVIFSCWYTRKIRNVAN